MMGETSGAQGQLFYQFNLDEVIPADHTLRKIDAALDLSDLPAQLAPYYSHIGRPSIDPELMIRMLLIGYCYGIRSERRLCEEVSLNLAYRWFAGSALRMLFPITRPSRRPATAAFATPTFCARWSGAKALQPTPASSAPTPTGKIISMAATITIGPAAPAVVARAVR